MEPLSRLTGGKKSKKLAWTEEMEKAYGTLIERMMEGVTLSFPNDSPGAHPLELFTDASGKGVGACLMQRQDGEMRPIAYASMTLNSAQQNYSTLERELTAIRWVGQVFQSVSVWCGVLDSLRPPAISVLD